VRALVIGGTGPTGPCVVQGLIGRGYDVAILHSGKHEAELPRSVEHIHGSAHFLDALEQALQNRTFDLVVAMYGRMRHVASVIRGKAPRLIAAGGMPYRAFVEGERGGRAVPVFVTEDAPLFRDAQSNKFSYLMTVSEEAVMDGHKAGAYDATILRFPMIYGPRQVAPREWCIIRRLVEGRKRIIIPDGGLKLERRGFVENVAHAVLLAVDKGRESAGEIFNVGDDTIWSLREWIEIIARCLDRQCEFTSMPFSIARPSRPYGGRAFHWVPAIDRIRNRMGYTDQVPAEIGLRRTVEWYMENRPEPGGEIERALGDPFDYEAEDRLIRDLEERLAGLRDIFPRGYEFHHAYEHPKMG
jgi:nucleoside-diphosphate-sugar epimerase